MKKDPDTPDYICDKYKALTDTILKENSIRQTWHNKYTTSLRTPGLVDWDADPDEDDCKEVSITSQWDPPTAQKITSKEGTYRPSAKGILKVGTIPRVERPPKVMYAASECDRRLIHQGTSRDGLGRANYLKHRYQRPPNERYRFPVVSSWEYGWFHEQDRKPPCPKHRQRSHE